ncbi:unnamed protein product [Caenorhabditis auriculariae]|uniref:CYTH domain-containing protein n=1 Tax=Caenorhabditis auriculariae TaxID=2777116 RepID=A0A8S1HV95_9PELO|nr:unnamed protein product [Caenorhabditis auriculariae]
MSRNVEIKAVIKSFDDVIKSSRQISGKEAVILRQHDVFYNSPNGRLKLRSVTEAGNKKTELIWYDRPDVAGPKVSNFTKFDVPESLIESMKATLQASMGVKGEIKKERSLFLYGQTRIHIDRVEGLGDFLELEVCLAEDDTVDKGEHIAREILRELGIKHEDLLEGAYMDMLINAGK